MSRTQRKYDQEYKIQAVKLAKEIGGAKAAKELGIPEGTIHTWLKAVRAGTLDIGDGAHTPESAMSLAEELAMLRNLYFLNLLYIHPCNFLMHNHTGQIQPNIFLLFVTFFSHCGSPE